MNICLVFGRSGQVGDAIANLAPTMPGLKIIQLDSNEADLTQPERISGIIKAASPRVVINAAAHTKVDLAESDEAVAHAINAVAPAAMAAACHNNGAVLIHFSTDYVFPGTGTAPYGEDDPTGPTGAYGRTKEAGERLIRQTLDRHVILRTSWVFSAHGRNFVKTMLKLDRDAIRVVDDQTGNPTPADAVARAALAIAQEIVAHGINDRGREDGWGTFHLAGAPHTTWFAFAQAIFNEAARFGHRPPKLEPIPTALYPTPARRPSWSVLDTAKIARVWGIAAPDWRSALGPVIERILTSP